MINELRLGNIAGYHWIEKERNVRCFPRASGAYYTIQIKLRWALFVTYTIIQNIMSSEMCSLHLTHPSGAVGSRQCGSRRAVGSSVPCSRVSPQSWTLPAGAGIRTNNIGLPQVSSPTLYPLGHDCPDFPTNWLACWAIIRALHPGLLWLVCQWTNLSLISWIRRTDMGAGQHAFLHSHSSSHISSLYVNCYPFGLLFKLCIAAMPVLLALSN